MSNTTPKHCLDSSKSACSMRWRFSIFFLCISHFVIFYFSHTFCNKSLIIPLFQLIQKPNLTFSSDVDCKSNLWCFSCFYLPPSYNYYFTDFKNSMTVLCISIKAFNLVGCSRYSLETTAS